MSRVFRLKRDKGLRPELLAFIDACAGLPFDTVIIRGLTTNAAQEALYAQGRTIPGPGASPARPMGSTVTFARNVSETPHGRAAAVDIAPIEQGVILWNDRAKFDAIGALAERMGLEWGGRFTRIVTRKGKSIEVPFYDGAHVQFKNWRRLSADFPEVS